MRIFLKSFLGALLALFVFSFLLILFILTWVGGITASQKPETGSRAVLYLDLGQTIHEHLQENPLASLGRIEQYDQPGLYDIVRLLQYAKNDSAVKGIYIRSTENPNGFATSEEIRNALADFKKSGKFIYAYGDVISQKAYYVANIADKIYCNPKGGVEWVGFSTRLAFLKDALKKLEIEPQIFYAGKFKSATEPLREEKMTDANRLQTTALLNKLYGHLLLTTSETRGVDTATLRSYASGHMIQYANDALKYRLVDGLKYDDEVKGEIRSRIGLEKNQKINWVSIAKYAEAVDFKRKGKDRIVLIYAEGDIVGGKGDQRQIGDATYRSLIRAARMDPNTKAVVIRINSGGGSSLASENIWREISITRSEKPVILSFGDVAASGAYYLACNADSIFAQPMTITGSIGVFSILPNMQSFFKNKLGIGFDGVKTAPDADMISVTKPLTPMQKNFLQNQVDSIYFDFKSRVASGRKKSMEYVDSIAQGRIWVGSTGMDLGLVDRLGSLQDAIDCAARMAKTTNYRLKEYPEPKTLLDILLGDYKRSIHVQAVKQELGEEGYKTYTVLQRLKEMIGKTQARMPVDLDIQ